MEKLKFSVLIPVYNVENYLGECIESVLKQTYKNFEIIIIDDGSNDKSGKICDEYEKKYKNIKVYHQDNQGLIMARRNGILKATGEFCLFLDSDDYWDLNLLSNINQTILKHNCDLIIFKYRRVTEDGKFIFEPESFFIDETIFDDNNKRKLFETIISTSGLNNLVCKAAKKSIIDNMDYLQYKDIKNGEDLLQSLPLLYNAKKIVYMNKAMYNYRVASGSITNRFNFNLIKDVTVVNNILLEYIRKMKIDNEENIRKFCQFYIELICNYIIYITNAQLTNKEKLDNIIKIKEIPLYKYSIKNINGVNCKFSKRILFELFYRNYYKILFLYIRLGTLLKKS